MSQSFDVLGLADLTHELWLADQAGYALKIYRQTECLLTGDRRPLRNLGNILRDLNRFEDADLAYAMAMLASARTGPREEFVGSAWNRSQILIGLERYPQAYALAEQRRHRYEWEPWRPAPFWAGWPNLACRAGHPPDPRPRKPLVVWSEQGYGDTLQYLRWLPLLLQRHPALKLKLEVEATLVPLLKRGLAWLGPGLVIAPKGCDPRPDPSLCHGSLLSLPWLLGGAPAAQFCPYLRDPAWHWTGTAPRDRPVRVGLLWASGRKLEHPFTQREYIRRSLPPEPLRRLLQGLHRAGAQLVMLQHGDDRDRPGEAGALFADRLPSSAGFAETVDRLAQLDLIISVDTAMAHLLGALGAPGWILLPWAADPRWLRQRPDSPWYPSLTLLRQPAPRDWEGLVDRVLAHFARWLQRSAR